MTARSENGIMGEKIVTARLIERSWLIENANEVIGPNCPNFDLIATKGEKTIRIQVKSKKHKEKTTLCGSWASTSKTFNKKANFPIAGFLIMVRFDDEGDECFVLPIDEAEEMAGWFAGEMAKLGKSPKHFYPYVSPRRRNTIYAFNTREVWEKYSENWSCLNGPNS